MPSQPPGASSSEATSSEYTDSETESETSSSNVSTPHLSASANRGVRGGPRLTRGASMNNSSGVIQDLDDAALADKMRKAQERLEGLDKHVADLRSRSVEQDALAKGKLPPEQTAAYLARVKELEIKRRELLERQMGVGEELQRVATTNGTLNNHRHGGTPRAQKENARRELVDRLRREEAAAQARLEAYKGGSFGAEAEAAHRTALARVDAAEAEAEAERERERVAALGRRREEEPPPPPPEPKQRPRDRRDRPDRSHDARPDRSHDAQPDHSHDAQPHFHDQPPPQYPYQQIPPHAAQPPGAFQPGTHYGFPPYGMGPGIGPMNPMNPMNPMHPMGMGGYPPYGSVGGPYYGVGAPYGADPFARRGRDDERGDGRRREPPATPDYAAKLRAQVDELQKSVASLLDVAKRGGGGIGGGRGGDDDVGARGSGVPDLPSLPEEIKDDAEIKKLYAQHLREMLKLQLNIGRESRVVELERLRTEMVQLKDGIVPPKGGAAQQQQPYPPYPPPPPGYYQPGYQPYGQSPGVPPYPQQQQQQPFPNRPFDESPGVGPEDDLGPAGRAAAEGMTPDPRPFTRRSGEATPADAGIPSLENAPSAGRQSRRSKTSGPNGRALTPVAESPRDGAGEDGVRARAEGGDGSEYSVVSGSESEYSDSYYSDDDSYYSDDSRERLRQGLGRDVPRVTVRVMMEGAGPMDLKDSPARLVAALYEGHEPSRDASGGAVRARGPLMEPSSHDRAGAARYKWRARVSLRGVAVTAATKLVLELHAAQPPDRNDAFGGGGAPGPEEVVAWAHIPVLGADGEPPSGLQVTPLLQLPLMLSAERTARLEGSKVEVRVWVEPENLDRDPTPPGTPRPGNAIAGGERGVGRNGGAGGGAPAWLGGGGAAAADAEANRKEDVPGVPRRAWREVRHVGAGGGGGTGDAFQTGDGLVFCVDAARFLPPNVTITRIVGRVISAAGEALAPEFIHHARLDSLAYSPRYHARQRFATGRWNNATAVALLQIETIEKGTSQQRTVGYVVFPFFVDPETGEPPASTAARGYHLKEGGWQVPVYAATGSVGSGFSLAEVLSRPKIPCASMLVRALVATRAETPANKAVPNYEDGAYDSGGVYPTNVERRLYAHRLAQPGPPVREAMLDLARQTFAPNVLSGMTEPDLERWMAKRLERPQFANEKPLNYRRSDPYVPDLGFHVAVDGAARLSKTAFHVAVQSLFPPGTFYSSKASDDVVFTQQPDVGSSLVAPKWRDGFHARQHVIHEPNLVVVIDVRALAGRTAQPAGWALLPVFEEGSEYIASGAFQLPLFQGPVQLPLMQDLVKGQAEGKTVQEVIQGWIDDKKVKFTADKSSVYVRLLEDQRLGMLPEPAGHSTPGVVFPPYVGEKLEPAFLKKSAGKPYAKNIPRGTLAEDYVMENNALVAASLGLPFVRGGAGFGAGLGDGDETYSDYTESTYM